MFVVARMMPHYCFCKNILVVKVFLSGYKCCAWVPFLCFQHMPRNCPWILPISLFHQQYVLGGLGACFPVKKKREINDKRPFINVITRNSLCITNPMCLTVLLPIAGPLTPDSFHLPLFAQRVYFIDQLQLNGNTK